MRRLRELARRRAQPWRGASPASGVPGARPPPRLRLPPRVCGRGEAPEPERALHRSGPVLAQASVSGSRERPRLPDAPAPAAAGRAGLLVPGSCPARSARGGGSGLRPAETERLEDEAAAAGRRMGANQLVVLNVYDMVSAAPGGPSPPARDPGPVPPACLASPPPA